MLLSAQQRHLIQQLRDLEAHGILSRTVHPQVPPKVEYRLTDLGQALAPVFLALLDWADLRAAAESKAEALAS
jgi:DNA-binding HxlR family transcriptional regulator